MGERKRVSEPVHSASTPVGCISSKREMQQAWPRRRLQSAQKALLPSRGERERSRSQQRGFLAQPPSRLLQDLGQVAQPIFAPIYSLQHGERPWCGPAPSLSILWLSPSSPVFHWTLGTTIYADCQMLQPALISDGNIR